MRDDKKREELEKELLAEAFDECMDEQLSFIPSEREIARMHRYSEDFQQNMQELLDAGGKPKRKKNTITQREFVYSFNKIAACILAVLVVSGVCTGLFLAGGKKSSGTADTAAPETASIMEDSVEEAADEGVETEGESAENTAASSAAGKENAPEKITFAGHDIYLTQEQNVTAETESVKTLVSSPVIARDAEAVKVTIGNISETPISYNANMELQVQKDGAWYVVTRNREPVGQQDTTVVLEPGMAQDEELDLTDYDLDYDADAYRIITYVDGEPFSAGFRFESVEQGLEEALEENK